MGGDSCLGRTFDLSLGDAEGAMLDENIIGSSIP